MKISALLLVMILFNGCMTTEEKEANFAKSGLEQCYEPEIYRDVIWVKSCKEYTNLRKNR